MTDLFEFKNNNETNNAAPPKSNVPEFSVGDLALSLKRTLEENFGHVRVRGELSRVSIAGSGHMYTSLKDDQALIDAVCWKGVLNRLSVRPEEGLEVIVTGKISSYPKSSKYQLVIESMELAGEGALLKMLEERKKKLAAEGLFDQGRKKRLPFVPNVIGVVTSPTGAVIRDILHRLQDRFPRHVIVWPVLVQGTGAAEQVARAIEGFDSLPDNGPITKPDLIIVARGGGSLEDLMPFNEEIVARAIATCKTPIISAVGHETDTTLADYAADYRAPTPTAAAEVAVPHRRDLMAQILDDKKRLLNGLNRLLNESRHKLEAQGARLGDPSRLLENKVQNTDFLGQKLEQVFKNFIQTKDAQLQRTAARITHPRHQIDQANQRLQNWSDQLLKTRTRLTEKKLDQLNSYARLLDSLSYEKILKRGYVVVRDTNDKPISDPNAISDAQDLQLEFADNKRVHVQSQ
ncbi:MAG: exodeoxyribonuclease VII large subunit [Micavibrio sp.]|nr:exodeoxyribonuclease VII large subunit [Micavibrio sp.]